MKLPPLWTHQLRAIPQVMYALRDHGMVVLTSPPRSGKTRTAMEIAKQYLDMGRRVEYILNRKMLAEQLMQVHGDAGFRFGRRMSGHFEDDSHRLQIAMMQTIHARTQKFEWEDFPADLIIVDEAHIQTGATVRAMLERRKRLHNAKVLGMTGTALDLAKVGYRHQVVAATHSELFKAGLLLPAQTFAPSEPDLRACAKASTNMSEEEVERFMKLKRIVGSIVWEIHDKNPELKPMVLYAPSVSSARWCVEELNRAGIRCASIDGEAIYYGERTPEGDPVFLTTQGEEGGENRGRLKEEWARGDIQCVCNRFVLREGIDVPELYMAILATVFSGVNTYVQSTARAMTANGREDHCRILDFGGNYWRYGSPNMDREWLLDLGEAEYERRHRDAQRNSVIPEPTTCKNCGKVLPDFHYGVPCPICKHVARQRFRRIIQERGELELQNRVNSPKPKKDPLQSAWDDAYWKCRNSGRTFNQVRGLFKKTVGIEPPVHKLYNVPLKLGGWNKRVRDVPRENLRRPKEE